MSRKKEFINVDGKRYTLIRKVYDPYYDCTLFYVEERDEPFCNLDVDIMEE